MSYIGSNKIGGMYLGGTEIAKAYLGSDLVFEKNNVVLPYDAQVEYLESTGTQYIDTGIVPDGETGFYAHIERVSGSDNYAIGLRDNTGNTRWVVGISNRVYAGYGTSIGSSPQLEVSEADVKLNYLNDMTFYVENNGNTGTKALSSLSWTPTNNIRLFGSAGVTGSYTIWYGRISFCKISQGSDIIMDLIPVRIGQVGYMYDTISGEFFGNDGTGSFTLGNDV